MIRKLLLWEQNFLKPIADFLERHILLFFGGILSVFCGLMICNALVSCGFLWDQIEHLHASYLVSIGMVPYKDFFEHHHPLFWYLLAPIMQLFYPSLIVIYVARFLILLFLMGCLWLLFIVTNKMYDRKVALLSILCLIGVNELWFDIMNLRPDMVMISLMLGGIYYFFDYLKQKKLSCLIISYLLWMVAFLLMQKTVLVGLGFGAANLRLLYKKKMPWRDFLLAVGVALIPLFGFIGWLTYQGIWAEYWWYNFSLNKLMTIYYSGYCGIPWIMICFLCLEAIGVLYYLNQNKHKITEEQRVWLWCTISSSVTVIGFMPHLQYLYPVFILMAPYMGYLFAHIFVKPRKYVVLLVCIFCNFWVMLPSQQQIREFKEYMLNMQFLMEKLPLTDEYVGLHHFIYNIYHKDAHYYWFGFKEVAMLDVLYNPEFKDFDFQSIIESKNPKYLFYTDIRDTVATRKFDWFAWRNSLIFNRIRREMSKRNRFFDVTVSPLPSFWPVDEDWLNEQYKQIPGTDIWQRKEFLQ